MTYNTYLSSNYIDMIFFLVPELFFVLFFFCLFFRFTLDTAMNKVNVFEYINIFLLVLLGVLVLKVYTVVNSVWVLFDGMLFVDVLGFVCSFVFFFFLFFFFGGFGIYIDLSL